MGARLPNVMPKAPAPPITQKQPADPVARVAVEADVRLPDDVVRCVGMQQCGDWMPECKRCARRLAPLNDPMKSVMMVPPLAVFETCPARIGA